MKLRVNPRVGLLAVAGALAASLASFTWVQAQQRGGATVALDGDDIGGVVASAKGPEAGVWVIAETTDLPAKFAKMVVTDGQGRYVLPDLPQASYQIFVRGYGLVDSPRVLAKPGQHLDLKAVVAPDGRAAAQVYPANYWLSLLRIPKGDLSDKDVDRRPKCRLEGSRVLVELLDVLALAPGRRQGDTAKDCEVPGPAKSSREIGPACSQTDGELVEA